MTATPIAELQVDSSAIEASLAALWRGEKKEGDAAVTRAALWNVVAHTSSPSAHTKTSGTLANASAIVPQRTIVIRAEPDAPSSMTSWISANCHLLGGKKQVCSEEVAIVAGGDRIHHVPPIVHALLIPDMPVAVWWVGDLPNQLESYVETLLDPADRLIVDSSFFDSAADFALVIRAARKTTTAPADLNWVRLEQWRVATASLFDPPAVRARLQRIKRLTVITDAGGHGFGDRAESLLYVSWLATQAGYRIHDDGTIEGAAGMVEYSLRTDHRPRDSGSVSELTIEFDDGSTATIRSEPERQALLTTIDGISHATTSVTRALGCRDEDLIVRQLQRSEADRVFMKVLPVAMKLAAKVNA